MAIIDRHGKDNVALLLPIFENYLDKKVRAGDTRMACVRRWIPSTGELSMQHTMCYKNDIKRSVLRSSSISSSQLSLHPPPPPIPSLSLPSGCKRAHLRLSARGSRGFPGSAREASGPCTYTQCATL